MLWCSLGRFRRFRMSRRQLLHSHVAEPHQRRWVQHLRYFRSMTCRANLWQQSNMSTQLFRPPLTIKDYEAFGSAIKKFMCAVNGCDCRVVHVQDDFSPSSSLYRVRKRQRLAVTLSDLYPPLSALCRLCVVSDALSVCQFFVRV